MAILADLVVLAHFAFVVFVILGGLLVLWWRWLAWLHVPAALWGMVVELAGWICPLTPLENWLRARAGGHGYEESFVEHYILPLLYPSDLTREIQIGLGVLVIVVNLGIYGVVLSRRRPPAP